MESLSAIKLMLLENMPSTTNVLSTYTAFTASAMLVRAVFKEVEFVTTKIQIIPKKILGRFFENNQSSQLMTLIINQHTNNNKDRSPINQTENKLFEASELYLLTKISTPSRPLTLEICQSSEEDEKFSLTIHPGQKIIDDFQGIKLIWEIIQRDEKQVIQLSFHKKYMEIVLNSYLSHVMETSRAIKEEDEEDKVVKLYGLIHREGLLPTWGSINLDHRATTLETIVMEPLVKKALIEDLDGFVKRSGFYKRVGKAWKRGYLLYGPRGTGKSSLIAAIANYLKFDIYDLELASVNGNSDLRRILLSTSDRSIIVIQDIDCTIDLTDRAESGAKVTPSGLLNFIDGLWSSCGDERIIIFTTNHKARVDSALLKPGRMDMQINMSYCTPYGFRILVSNYFGIKAHKLFAEIDGLIKEMEVTPSEIVEELMKSEDAGIALEGLRKFLQKKKAEIAERNLKVGEKRKVARVVETEGGAEIVERNSKVGEKRKEARVVETQGEESSNVNKKTKQDCGLGNFQNYFLQEICNLQLFG